MQAHLFPEDRKVKLKPWGPPNQRRKAIWQMQSTNSECHFNRTSDITCTIIINIYTSQLIQRQAKVKNMTKHVKTMRKNYKI